MGSWVHWFMTWVHGFIVHGFIGWWVHWFPHNKNIPTWDDGPRANTNQNDDEPMMKATKFVLNMDRDSFWCGHDEAAMVWSHDLKYDITRDWLDLGQKCHTGRPLCFESTIQGDHGVWIPCCFMTRVHGFMVHGFIGWWVHGLPHKNVPKWDDGPRANQKQKTMNQRWTPLFF